MPATSFHPEIFRPTRWSLVLAARDNGNQKRARKALEDLCAIYWPPLYSYARRNGSSPHDAEDLTQSFFRHIFEKDIFASANQGEGTMRSFLRTSFRNFIINEHHRGTTKKRGGQNVIVPIDGVKAEELYSAHLDNGSSPEAEYDRRWGVAMLEKGLKQMEGEYAAIGRADLFHHLIHYLDSEKEQVPAATLASTLGISAGAVRKAGERMRKRFSVVLTDLVRQTLKVPTPEQIESEVAALQQALGRR